MFVMATEMKLKQKKNLNLILKYDLQSFINDTRNMWYNSEEHKLKQT